MGKKVSVTELRNRLGSLLDQLAEGQSHFVVERGNQEVAVLLSIEKFRDIMQMLELLNTLDFIETGADELGRELSDGLQMEFPDLTLLRPAQEATRVESNSHSQERGKTRLEDVAAKLGIRVIK